uniref:Uncharacterized protein n=1 Tax=Glossina pallidipes TaxID=7398 RepID=A0A1A9ZGQ6_GLOPL
MSIGFNLFSTSDFKRLKRKGFSTACKRCIKASSPKHVLVLDHESKSSEELKTSGNKKFSRAHNSCKLFCKGVPVINKRFAVLNSRNISDNLDFSFFIRGFTISRFKFVDDILKTPVSHIDIQPPVNELNRFHFYQPAIDTPTVKGAWHVAYLNYDLNGTLRTLFINYHAVLFSYFYYTIKRTKQNRSCTSELD